VTVTDGVHLDGSTSGVRVVAGQPAAARVRLERAGAIAVRLVDAGTGAPVDGCVDALQATRIQGPGEGVGDCSFDGTGQVTLRRIRPEPYVLFASTYDGSHGAQWVGPYGGVGSKAAARVVSPGPGGTVAVTVRLDPPGSVAGTVTDRATGAPVAGADVSAWGAAATTDATGHYTLDALGPYRWTLYVSQDAYAGQWSAPLRVRAGQVTPYDVALGKGSTVTGRITGDSGRLPDSAAVSIVDAHTFDVLARVDAGPDGRYTAHVSGPVDVTLIVEAEFRGCFAYVWRRAPVPARGGILEDVTVAEPCVV
jgi:hypothetical protein